MLFSCFFFFIVILFLIIEFEFLDLCTLEARRSGWLVLLRNNLGFLNYWYYFKLLIFLISTTLQWNFSH
jgi:hypothetical protein